MMWSFTLTFFSFPIPLNSSGNLSRISLFVSLMWFASASNFRFLDVSQLNSDPPFPLTTYRLAVHKAVLDSITASKQLMMCMAVCVPYA